MNPTQTEPTDLTRFDVRLIPCRVKHAQIFQRWNDLSPGQHFVLINDHDPIPLYHQFAAQFPGAFHWEYLVSGPEEFQVKITKIAPVTAFPATAVPSALSSRLSTLKSAPIAASVAPTASTLAAKPGFGSAGNLVQIDARGLEPPEPLIRILDALESLPAGFQLRALTDREPCHLFGEAGQRGFRHKTAEQPDRSWITVLDRV
jgi:uncharacterized protein (DUF2249 family)